MLLMWGASRWTPRTLFAAGEQGVWYDPSDFSALYQDAAGTTPVTAVGQPVGLLLDKRLGAPQARRNALTFSEAFANAAWTKTGTAPTITDNYATSPDGTAVTRMQFTASGSGNRISQIASSSLLPSGATDTISFYAKGEAGGEQITVWNGWSDLQQNITLTTARQLYTFTFANPSPSTGLYLYATSGTPTIQVDSAQLEKGSSRTSYQKIVSGAGEWTPGNHSTQSTTTSRPTLQALYNLLTKTEQFDDAAWTKSAATVTPNADGVYDKLIADGTNASHRALQNGFSVGGTGVFRLRVKPSGLTKIGLKESSTTGAQAVFDLTSGTVINTILGTATAITPTITQIAAGEFLIGMTVAGASSQGFQVSLVPNTYTTGDVNAAWTGNAVDGVLVGYADLRTSDDAAKSIPAYQRVNTTSDYDTAGFPYRLQADGVAGNLSAASGGGGTTGILLCAAIRPNGGAGTARTLWSDASTNTGYRVRINASNQLELAAGNGTAYTTVATVATLPVGETHVLTLWDDGVNLNAQIDNGAVASVARPAVSAGTAGFTLFKDNGAATSFLQADTEQFVYLQNTAKTAADRARLKTFVGAKAGLSL